MGLFVCGHNQSTVGARTMSNFSQQVDVLPEASKSTMGSIYVDKDNKSYITVPKTTEEGTEYQWVTLCSSTQDLQEYYTKGEVDSLLGIQRTQTPDLSNIDDIYVAEKEVSTLEDSDILALFPENKAEETI